MESSIERGGSGGLEVHDVRVDGARLRAWRCGEGEPILFVQGTAVGGLGWTPQLARFSREWSCAAWDHRGYGSSSLEGDVSVPAMAADGVALLDAFGWDRAHVVGHSLGGLVCQEIALSWPERVRSLTLSCTFLRGRQATRLTPGVIWRGLRTQLGTRAMRRRAFLAMIAPPDRRTEAEAERLAPLLGRDLADSPPVLRKQLRAMATYDRSSELGSIEVPTLVQSAGDDVIAPPVFGRALAGAVPGARFVLLDGTHAHPLLDPEPFDRMLEAHLRS